MELMSEDLPQWRWYRRRRERPPKYQPPQDVDTSAFTDLVDKTSHFLNCILCLFARNYYAIKLFALFVCGCINMVLLTFRYAESTDDLTAAELEGLDADDDFSQQIVHGEMIGPFNVNSAMYWMSFIHTMLSVIMLECLDSRLTQVTRDSRTNDILDTLAPWWLDFIT